MSISGILDRPRLILALALLLSLGGVVSWFTMAREEDPKIASRTGLIVAPYPGASAADVERLVAVRIEEELAEVEAIEHVDVTIRTGVAIFNVTLLAKVEKGQTDDAWDDVREALARVRAELPESAITPTLNDSVIDTEAVLIAVHGHRDVLKSADVAEKLETELLRLRDVLRVETSGDPGARMTVDFDDASARRLGIDTVSLADSLKKRNRGLPAGSLHLGDRAIPLRSSGDLKTPDELASLPVPVRPDRAGRALTALPLGQVAEVKRTIEAPRGVRARFRGEPAVFLGVVPRNRLQAVEFGEQVSAVVDSFRARHPDTAVDVVAFQPARVQARLQELGGSLLLGVGIVAAVVLLLMGLRMGLVVASIVPLVTFASVSVYATGGGILHQIAVAALVIALGLLVDNAIVVAELIQRRLDAGDTPEEASTAAVRELALPLGAATATTLASFVPMLLAEGTSGDFTRAIPVVVMLTLVVSYGYALFVTPLVARFGLKANRTRTKESMVDTLAGRLGALSARRPVSILGGALLIVMGSASFATKVGFNFFPTSDRNQFIVQIELPEGTHLSATDEVTRRIERFLDERDAVTSTASFVGRSSPRFYYNLPNRPNAPHISQVVVNTASAADVDPLREQVEAYGAKQMPAAIVLAKRLEQGPPVPAPIQLRLYHHDLKKLHTAATQVKGLLRDIEGARQVRDDQGLGLPTLELRVDDAAAMRHGVERERVALALLSQTRGLPAGTYRGGDDPEDLVLRSRTAATFSRGDAIEPNVLYAADIPRPGAAPLPLLEVVRPSVDLEPAVIHRRDRRRVVNVFAEHAGDVTAASIMKQAETRLAEVEHPEGVEYEGGGAVAESKKANAALGKNGPYGALLLVVVLLAEFNSFRRVLIILATAPLAALGIWPGLYIAGLPFGFVALLGAIALIGIAVNGAIVLIDVADREVKNGAGVHAALETAVRLRTRPILLTATTTVAGLAPLLFSESTLWPPLASAMISGLIIATLLTLGVVPALYRLFLGRGASPDPAASAASS